MLLKRKKKQNNEEVSPSLALYIPYSKGFRGFKRLKLTTYQDPLVDLDAIRNAPDPDRVLFEEYIYPDTPPLFRVSFDGIRLGTIWSYYNEDYYAAIRNGRVSKVSMAIDGDEVFLFIKID